MADSERRIAGSGYEIRYSGGRLADVYFAGHCMECVQVRDYDVAHGTFGPEPTNAEIRRQVAAFIKEAGGVRLYIDNLPN